jgi:hypothetical protein
MIPAQWNVVIQLSVLANLTRAPRDERHPYESLAPKYKTNSPTKQRDLFQAT